MVGFINEIMVKITTLEIPFKSVSPSNSAPVELTSARASSLKKRQQMRRARSQMFAKTFSQFLRDRRRKILEKELSAANLQIKELKVKFS
jgi:hypothetical protein